MPIFDYQCKDCGSRYDIYHKVREVAEDVVCPSCGSHSYTRLISAPMVAIAGSVSSTSSSSSTESSGGGCCCGGACGLD